VQNQTPNEKLPGAFFALTFLLSLPLYVLNALAYLEVVFQPEMGVLYVSLLTLTPIVAASILTYRRSGWDGVKKLFRRIFDCRRITKKKWYAAILMLMPLIFLLSLGVMVFSGAQIPSPLVPVVALPAVFTFFFILAAGEEVGWMGYAFEPMQARSGALRASLLLGTIWAVWHVPFFVFLFPDPLVVLARVLTLVGTRVLAGWIFNNAGQSVFAVILFHAVDNVALVALPEIDSISPWATVVHAGLVLIAAFVVSWLWGAETLSRFRFAKKKC
jgi:membrane protease YdiL (CAAX protease family)